MARFLPRKRALAIRRANRKGLYRAWRAARARNMRGRGGLREDPPVSKESFLAQQNLETFTCPEVMDLEENAQRTIEFIHDLHSTLSAKRTRPFYLDFKPIRIISPSAALLLAAELFTWNELHPKIGKVRAVDVDEWNPNVRHLLHEMGFFTLLRIGDKSLKWDPNDLDAIKIDTRFLPFRSGLGADGAAATKFRDQIERFAGRLKDRYAFYDGVVEAMTNVGQHAYRYKAKVKNWWISASIDGKNRTLRVICLDHGLGIPRTLPRKNSEALRGLFDNLGLAEMLKDDAQMIQAAIDLERSSTRKAYRGHGLKRDIQRYVESHDSRGHLMIFSNRGVYRFTRERDGKESASTDNNPASLHGTLIEWTIEDYAETGDENN